MSSGLRCADEELCRIPRRRRNEPGPVFALCYADRAGNIFIAERTVDSPPGPQGCIHAARKATFDAISHDSRTAAVIQSAGRVCKTATRHRTHTNLFAPLDPARYPARGTNDLSLRAAQPASYTTIAS
jgi:hypothetical protein